MTNVNGISSEHLMSFIVRLERLEKEKQDIADCIKDVLGESKSSGFCTKTIKAILKIRKKDLSEMEEEEMILHTYMLALGMKEKE